MARPILKYPDKRLRLKASPIERIDERIKRLGDELIEALAYAGGLGLAAPQLGESLRLILIDLPESPELVLINPRLIEADHGNEVPFNEGCLSLPGVEAEVWRPDHVLVRAWTLEEKEIELEREGLPARVLLHELDHLDGILFLDRLGPAKRKLLLKEYERIGRDGGRGGIKRPGL
ncbi:MAG: peptide deformylase [Candidatus Bipolaricaulia bacterium]